MSHEVVWLFRYFYDIITMLELEKERKKNAQIISHLTRECMLLHVEAGFHLLDFLTQPVRITKAWGQGWTFLSTLLILEGKLVFFAFNPVLPQKPPRAGFQPRALTQPQNYWFHITPIHYQENVQSQHPSSNPQDDL